jgi:FixJ family two-component response regulator
MAKFPSAVRAPNEAKQASSRKLISIVDDDQSIREAMESLIRSVGFRTEVFASAEDFLKWKERESTACLILDVRLPGISGLELQRLLTSVRSRIPVIFITAHGDAQTRERAIAAGAVEFLQKPFSEEALLEAVRAALPKSQ